MVLWARINYGRFIHRDFTLVMASNLLAMGLHPSSTQYHTCKHVCRMPQLLSKSAVHTTSTPLSLSEYIHRLLGCSEWPSVRWLCVLSPQLSHLPYLLVKLPASSRGESTPRRLRPACRRPLVQLNATLLLFTMLDSFKDMLPRGG